MSVFNPDEGMAAVTENTDSDTGISPEGKDRRQVRAHCTVTVTQTDWV